AASIIAAGCAAAPPTEAQSILPPVDAPETPAVFIETPSLVDDVKAGRLPPVAQQAAGSIAPQSAMRRRTRLQ
ncbi:MAG: hypothetical protein AAFU50_02375, partial [Pseudomonadota bacterium]